MTTLPPIYLDYAADTPLDPVVLKAMTTYLNNPYHMGNAASTQHIYGSEAAQIIEIAAQQVAQLIGAQPHQLIWTSGATEANNMAIQGVANVYQQRGKHIVTTAIEHKAVLDVCTHLAAYGYTVTYVKPQANGVVAIDDLAKAIRDDTILLSVMHVNNETGAIQNIQQIAELARKHKVLFHVDAAQSVARIPIDVERMGIDLLSLSGHKLYGPAGIGALYVAPTVQLSPLFYGGGQQRGLRPGSLPVLPILGMGVACEQARQQMEEEQQRIRQLTKRLWKGICQLDDVILHGELDKLAPGFLNVTFSHITASALITALTDIAVSVGSACMSTSSAPSHVLLAMGQRHQAAHNAIRFSIGRMTTEEEIDKAICHIHTVVNRLRAMSPMWALAQADVDIEAYPWERVQ